MEATRDDDCAALRAPAPPPPAVLTPATLAPRRSGGLRAGFGLDWLLVRADGRATGGGAASTPLTPGGTRRRG